MKVILSALTARLLAVPTLMQAALPVPKFSAGYSAAFLTLAGVVGGGGVTFQSPNGCKPGLFSAGSNERCSG